MIDDEIRTANRNGDHGRAIRLQARANYVADSEQSAAVNYTWESLDGRVFQLHQITDGHLENIVKLKIRRFAGGWRAIGRGRVGLAVARDPEDLRHIFRDFATREGDGASILLGECDRRNMPRKKWVDYLLAVMERRCDDCGERRRPASAVFSRGPAERLQCGSCAKKYELRCSKCDKVNTGEFGNGSKVRGLGIGAEPTRVWRGARCLDLSCRTLLSWMPKKGKRGRSRKTS